MTRTRRIQIAQDVAAATQKVREPISTRLLIIAVWALANVYGIMLLASRAP